MRGHTAYKVRAYPTVDQMIRARRIVGCCRVVKQVAWDQREVARRFGCAKRPTYTGQSQEVLGLRRDCPEAPWLAEAPAQVLQQAVADVDNGFNRWAAGIAAKPRRARKGGVESFRDPQKVRVERLSKRWGQVKVQGLGLVRFRWHRPISRQGIKSATVTLTPDGHMWISILVEHRLRRPDTRVLPAVGVDRGVDVPVALSDGTLFGTAFRSLTGKEAERKRRLERKLARQQKGSRNREKTKQQIAGLTRRAARRRRDMAHKVSHHLANNHSLVVFEALQIANMTASASGTIDEPGTKVAQKTGLNRGILDKGWGQIMALTAQKMPRLSGGTAVTVPAHNTSISCFCGHADKANRPRRDLFRCVNCGHVAHADVHAAGNIRQRGMLSIQSERVGADGPSVHVRLGDPPKTRTRTRGRGRALALARAEKRKQQTSTGPDQTHAA